MEIRTVRTFLAVAETGSFSRAAEKLGYSQSAATVHVQRLETELGVRLLDRVPHGAVLTQAGRAFSFHAREMLLAAERAVGAVEGADGSDPAALRGTLRVGSVESIATAILPDLLARYHRAYPRIELVVQTARREQLMERVRDNRLDLFLAMEEKINEPDLDRRLLRREPIQFAAPAGMARELAQPLGADALCDLPFVLTERGESYRRELDRLLAERDRAIAPAVEAGNTETLVHLVERGVGLSFLPRFSVAHAVGSGTVATVETALPPVAMWSQLVTCRGKWAPPYMEGFIRMAEELFQEEPKQALP